jgi:hypothetical protein
MRSDRITSDQITSAQARGCGWRAPRGRSITTRSRSDTTWSTPRARCRPPAPALPPGRVARSRRVGAPRVCLRRVPEAHSQSTDRRMPHSVSTRRCSHSLPARSARTSPTPRTPIRSMQRARTRRARCMRRRVLLHAALLHVVARCIVACLSVAVCALQAA